MAFIFDHNTHLIHVEAYQTDILVQDLHDSIRDEEYTLTPGMQDSKIADASGKDDLGGGVYTGITLKLISPWQVKYWEDPIYYPAGYIAKISGGNLIGGYNDDPVAYTAGVQVLLIQSASSTIIDMSGITDWTDDEKKQIRYKIGIDGDTLVPSSNVEHLSVDLNDDAIKAAKYDETTAYPIVLPDTGATKITRVGEYDQDFQDILDRLDEIYDLVESGGTPGDGNGGMGVGDPMLPHDITLRFVDPAGVGKAGVRVMIHLNGDTMFLTNGYYVSTKELVYFTDADGEVTFKMFSEDQFDKDKSRGLTDPPSYTVTVPYYSIQRVIALPSGGNKAADIVDIEDIADVDEEE